MKTLYIIRGLPGSGKSTLAGQLGYTVREADQFFMVNDKYCYDREKIGEAHAYCQNRVKLDMEIGVEKIAVSNTFVKRWEIEPYLKLAQTYGYRIVEITMSGPLYGNIHNVPVDVVQRMDKEWER